MSLFLPIFRALNDAGARYVVVGGFAVVLHGHARLTADIDLIVDLEREEALKVIGALSRRGFVPRAPVRGQAFADAESRRSWIEEKNMKVFSLYDPARPLVAVDLFVEHPIDFEELYARSEVIEVGGVGVRTAALSDLIALKRLAGRPEDLRDIEALEEIDRMRREEPR